MSTLRRRCAPQAGFSYLGVLLLVALIGVALAAGGELARTVLRRERETQLLFVGHEYRHAFTRFFRQNRRYPATLDELVTVDGGGALPEHYLRRLYRDPMTHALDWTLLPAPVQGIMGVASSSHDMPLKHSGFDLADESFEKAETYGDWIFAFDPRGTLPAQPGAATQH